MKITLHLALAYWDALWQLALPGATFASQAQEMKHTVIDGMTAGDLSMVDFFSDVHTDPADQFESVLRQCALSRAANSSNPKKEAM